MINIRRSVFETNSSSVHSITVLTAKEYSRWKTGDCVIEPNSSDVISKNDAIKRARLTEEEKNENVVEQELASRDYYTYDTFYDIIGERFETRENKITKDGQELVVISYSGYDG